MAPVALWVCDGASFRPRLTWPVHAATRPSIVALPGYSEESFRQRLAAAADAGMVSEANRNAIDDAKSTSPTWGAHAAARPPCPTAGSSSDRFLIKAALPRLPRFV